MVREAEAAGGSWRPSGKVRDLRRVGIDPTQRVTRARSEVRDPEFTLALPSVRGRASRQFRIELADRRVWALAVPTSLSMPSNVSLQLTGAEWSHSVSRLASC
jgi:hypothetical protein